MGPGLTLPANSGEYGIFGKVWNYFVKPVIKVVKSGYWAGSAKIVLGVKKKYAYKNRESAKSISCTTDMKCPPLQ